jgi:hypothetical protein
MSTLVLTDHVLNTGVEVAAQRDTSKPDELVGRCHYTQLPRLQKGTGNILPTALATKCLCGTDDHTCATSVRDCMSDSDWAWRGCS